MNTDDGTLSPQSHPVPAGRTASGLAINPGSKRLYVSLEPAAAGNLRQLLVVDRDDLAGTPLRTVDVPDSAGGPIFMAVTPDGRLLRTYSAGAQPKLNGYL